MRSLMIASGVVLTGLLLCAALLPWWKQRRHLLSFWNFFLLGSMIFISMSLVQNAESIGGRGAEFDSEIATFISASFVFYGLATLVYLWPSRPQAKAQVKPTQIWPAETDLSIVVTAALLATAGPLIPLIPPFPGVQVLYVTNAPMSVAALALAVIYTTRHRVSFLAYGLVAYCLGTGMLNVLTYGTGRRELLALFASAPLVAYWFYFRHRPRGRTLMGITALASVGIVVVTSYATVRHNDRDLGNSATKAVTRIKKLPEAIVTRLTNFDFFGGQGSVFDGQNAVWAGILTISLTHEHQTMEQDPLALAKFIAFNPVPRSLWPNKPLGLGKILPLQMGEPRVTWGPSIIGHCFYDGGWPVVILYGLSIGGILRFLDTRMLYDPSNPWLIALQCSVVGHAIGFARGDCGTFGVNILGPLVILTLALQPMRFLFGPRPNPRATQFAAP